MKRTPKETQSDFLDNLHTQCSLIDFSCHTTEDIQTRIIEWSIILWPCSYPTLKLVSKHWYFTIGQDTTIPLMEKCFRLFKVVRPIFSNGTYQDHCNNITSCLNLAYQLNAEVLPDMFKEKATIVVLGFNSDPSHRVLFSASIDNHPYQSCSSEFYQSCSSGLDPIMAHRKKTYDHLSCLYGTHFWLGISISLLFRDRITDTVGEIKSDIDLRKYLLILNDNPSDKLDIFEQMKEVMKSKMKTHIQFPALVTDFSDQYDLKIIVYDTFEQYSETWDVWVNDFGKCEEAWSVWFSNLGKDFGTFDGKLIHPISCSIKTQFEKFSEPFITLDSAKLILMNIQAMDLPESPEWARPIRFTNKNGNFIWPELESQYVNKFFEIQESSDAHSSVEYDFEAVQRELFYTYVKSNTLEKLLRIFYLY